jgi:DNA repair protein RadC
LEGGKEKVKGERRGGTGQPIREWIEEERPREALFAFGAKSLSLAKLFAIILRTGKRGVNAEELSRRLLNTFSGLRGIDSAPISKIRGIVGIGPAKAAQIKAALEIGKRFCRETAKGQGSIENPQAALEYVSTFYGPYLRDARSECACVILLNRRNRPIRAVELTQGAVGTVDVDPAQIVREALQESASSLVLVHNHPSGDGEPSRDDVSLTFAVRDACNLFGIRLLDHVIIGKDPMDYFSFARKGLLSFASGKSG